MTEQEPAGIVFLRAATKSRNKSPSALALTASDAGASPSELEALGLGKGSLTDDQLQKPAKSLYSHSEYVPELGLMRSANRAPTATNGRC